MTKKKKVTMVIIPKNDHNRGPIQLHLSLCKLRLGLDFFAKWEFENLMAFQHEETERVEYELYGFCETLKSMLL